MGPCAGSDGDLLFEKSNVNLTRMEEFSFGPLFNNGSSGMNGWKTADYKDPKRRASGILRITHEATAGALGKNLVQSCLDKCELPVFAAVGKSLDSLVNLY